jgi:formylglycine-generating enzyme required for sulfatase activity
MVVIPEGSYEMGSSGASSSTEERPRHSVRVVKFAMSKHEITFAEYEKFAMATGRAIPDNLYMEKDTHPVIYVSWDDAFYYARWLSEQTGEDYNLASEAQWEYAAGTGARSSFWWGYNEEPGRAHCFGCGSGLDPRKPTKVGSFGPNDFGIHDTAGNVAEWVRDCWHDNYDGAPTRAEVWEGGDCSFRVVRGGSYSSPPSSIRHAKRDKFKSDSSYDHIGIRVVKRID